MSACLLGLGVYLLAGSVAQAQTTNLPGAVVAGNAPGVQNIEPESQTSDRPEATTTILAPDPTSLRGTDFLAQTGYFILLESNPTTLTIPEALPSLDAAGVRATGANLTTLLNPVNWSDVVWFQPLGTSGTDATRSNTAIYLSDPDVEGQSITATFTAQGVPLPTSTSNVAFLLERTGSNSGDTGAGESNADHRYNAGGINGGVSYNIHSDPRVPTVIPEPSTMAIAGLGALGFVGFGLRRRLKK